MVLDLPLELGLGENGAGRASVEAEAQPSGWTRLNGRLEFGWNSRFWDVAIQKWPKFPERVENDGSLVLESRS